MACFADPSPQRSYRAILPFVLIGFGVALCSGNGAASGAAGGSDAPRARLEARGEGGSQELAALPRRKTHPSPFREGASARKVMAAG